MKDCLSKILIIINHSCKLFCTQLNKDLSSSFESPVNRGKWQKTNIVLTVVAASSNGAQQQHQWQQQSKMCSFFLRLFLGLACWDTLSVFGGRESGQHTTVHIEIRFITLFVVYQFNLNKYLDFHICLSFCASVCLSAICHPSVCPKTSSNSCSNITNFHQ